MKKSWIFILSMMLVGGLGFAEEMLPRGFRSIFLGVSFEEAKELLKKDPYFIYKGDPDLSLLQNPNEVLIDTQGASFLSRALLQFYGGALHTVTLMLNTQELDYYTMYVRLSTKYGEPETLNPDQALWMDESVIMRLERPLTVKYIDRKVMESLRQQSLVDRSIEEVTRDKFLEQF